MRHDAALRVLDWCDARRAERRDDVAQAPPEKAAKAVEALFDASSKLVATEDDVAAASTVYGRARRDPLAAIGAHRSTPCVDSPRVAECLARLFANAVDAKDARDAAQAMALAATFCAAGASTPLVHCTSAGIGPVQMSSAPAPGPILRGAWRMIVGYVLWPSCGSFGCVWLTDCHLSQHSPKRCVLPASALQQCGM